MLKYIYDHMHQGKMKDGLQEFNAALDEAFACHARSAEIFVKMDTHYASGLRRLHLVIARNRWRTAASGRVMKNAGWSKLGKIADQRGVIAERFERKFGKPWSNEIYAFVHDKWVGTVATPPKFKRIYVSAPVQTWHLVSKFQTDLTKQAEDDWAALTAANGCVKFAHLQLLPS